MIMVVGGLTHFIQLAIECLIYSWGLCVMHVSDGRVLMFVVWCLINDDCHRQKPGAVRDVQEEGGRTGEV